MVSSRGLAGATSVALTLAHMLGSLGRTIYIEADFLKPTIIQSLRSAALARSSNEWLVGEAPLEDSCVDISSVAGLPSGSLYALPASTSDADRRRMEVLDLWRDKRILSTLEGESWIVGGRPLDYVVIDTSPLMNYLLGAVSFVSDFVINVITPRMSDLVIFEERMKMIYSKLPSKIRLIVNYHSEDRKTRIFYRQLKDRTGIEPVKIPYIPELRERLDPIVLLGRGNPLRGHLSGLVNEIAGRIKVFEEIV